MMGGRGLGHGRLLGFIQTLPSPSRFSCTELFASHWLTIGGRAEGQAEGSFSRREHTKGNLKICNLSCCHTVQLLGELMGQVCHDWILTQH